MSFLNSNDSEYLSGRITQKGRSSIANGTFNISYFTIGDSEFVYSNPFSGLTGNVTTDTIHQRVLTPFDHDNHIKYPIKYDTNPIYHGIPVPNPHVDTIRNVMGPAGFVSNYKDYDTITNLSGTTIQCLTNEVSLSALNGSSTIAITKQNGTTYNGCEYVTLILNELNINGQENIISGNSNNFIYKILNVVGDINGTTETLTLDRPTPNFSSLSGNATFICNKCQLEFDTTVDLNSCNPILPDTTAQHNSWSLEVIRSEKPIGYDVSGLDKPLSQYETSRFISLKELLGYNSTGQTFINALGNTINGTTYKNTTNEEITLLPQQQKVIAALHFSDTSDIMYDPNVIFKYDDYISNKTGITGNDISIVDDINGDPISDTQYFEVYLPFINYHRKTDSKFGSVFKMGVEDFYIKSSYNENSTIKFRYLLDGLNNKIGKVFVDKKVIVFDDEEIATILDYKSNRTYTLPAPKTIITPTDNGVSLLNGSTGQTLWVTYTFSYTGDTSHNGVPCNYYSKIDSTTIPSDVIIKFNNEFSYMKTTLNNVVNGFVANKFIILAQKTLNGANPNPQNWVAMDFTAEAGGDGVALLNPTNLNNVSFKITNSKYSGGSTFDIQAHTGEDFSDMYNSIGNSQPFPGSIRLVRSTDIEVMNYLVNLPSGKFITSQNPTKLSNPNMNIRVTEISLLNKNKELMVSAKTTKPIERTGTQVFSVKLDF